MVELIILIGFIVWLAVTIKRLPQIPIDYPSSEPWFKRIEQRERREEKVKEDFFMRE